LTESARILTEAALSTMTEQDMSPKARIREELKRAVSKHKVIEYINANRPLLGLFVPAPSYPHAHITVDRFLTHGLPRLAFIMVFASLLVTMTIALLSWLRSITLLCIILPPAFYGGYCRVKKTRKAAVPCKVFPDEAWETSAESYFDPSCPGAFERRRQVAEEIIDSVDPDEATKFNAHVGKATALAIYGCGILAATHVGGLRALERHGLQYPKLKTIAGVSAGSVVAAMLAIGCEAQDIFKLIEEMPFYKLALPELGSLVRILGTILQSMMKSLLGSSAAAVLDCVADGTGPGLNSGYILEEMIGSALKQKCGDEHITLKAVKDRFGKRLVILACELDSGKERRFTPETDPELPLRVAVRMSMGVPGLMEPFSYRGHMYCDGGMCNDFPMNALPESEIRLGLMVRPVDWIQHHSAGLDAVIHKEKLATFPKAAEHLTALMQQKPMLFSVKTILDLSMTSVNIMMDANLVLQIAQATAKMNLCGGGISELAPEILTLCGGRLDPFDFNLSNEQHRELYLSGQLSTHLHASMVDESTKVMSEEQRLKLLLYCMHLDYPSD